MFRAQKLFRGALLAGALAVISIPAIANAGGYGKFGYSYGCYPKYCAPIYTPCYQPCTYPLWNYQCYTPCVQPYVVQQPLVQPYVQTFATPYVSSYGGCKVFIHKK